MSVSDILQAVNMSIRSGFASLRFQREEAPQGSERREKVRLPANEPGELEWLDSKGERHSQRINIRELSDNGVGFSLKHGLRIGQTVWLATDRVGKCKAVVKHSREETGGFFVGAIRVYRERRRLERTPAGGGGTLHWGGSPGSQKNAEVLVRDASDYGLQIQVPTTVPVPAVVRLEGQEADCFGSTCYCEPYQGQYLVGLHVLRRINGGEIEQFIT